MPLVVKKCVHCGKSFETYYPKVRECCSRACKAARCPLRGRDLGGKITKNCLRCGKYFESYKSKRQKFCGDACADKQRGEAKRGIPRPAHVGELVRKAKTGVPRDAATIEKMRRSALRYWRELTADERQTEIRKRNIRGHIAFTSKHGIEIFAHSSWEQHMYETLQKLRVSFLYSNEDDTAFNCGRGGMWFPDFILPRKRVIIEVKGIWRKDFDRKLPHFVRRYGKKYDVALCKRDVDPRLFSSFRDLDRVLDYVHVR